MAEIKSESVADFTSESAAGFARNPHSSLFPDLANLAAELSAASFD
jgi:hypothetical protein